MVRESSAAYRLSTEIGGWNLSTNSLMFRLCVSRSYGLPEKVLMNRYLFKPSSTSVITVMGMDIASMVGNAFMVEQVFNWPGFSKYGANAMITKDLNSVCAVVLVIGATFLVVNLIVDVINAMVDPRIRLGGDL